MSEKLDRIAILTSGGDCPGMNAGIRAAVRTALANGVAVTGIRRGYQGPIDGDPGEPDHKAVSGIINRGGTILCTARCMEFYEPEGRRKVIERCRAEGIDALITFGGDGTFRGAAKLAEESEIRVVGVPGTIDNDLYGSDYTIGFDTAVNTAVECIDKLRDTADALEQAALAQGTDKQRRGAHGANGMGAGRPDTDLEQVEHTNSHDNLLNWVLQCRHHRDFASAQKSHTDSSMSNSVSPMRSRPKAATPNVTHYALFRT